MKNKSDGNKEVLLSSISYESRDYEIVMEQ